MKHKMALSASLLVNMAFVGFFGSLILERGGVTYVLRKFGVERVEARAYQATDIVNYFRYVPRHNEEIQIVGDSVIGSAPTSMYFGRVKNFAIGGDRVENVLARIDELVARRPQRVIMMMGINDVFGNQLPLKTMQAYEAVIAKYQQAGVRDITVLSILPFNYRDGVNAVDVSGRIKHMNGLIGRMALRRSCKYVSLWEEFADRDGNLKVELTFDGFHLNMEGQFMLLRLLRERGVEVD